MAQLTRSARLRPGTRSKAVRRCGAAAWPANVWLDDALPADAWLDDALPADAWLDDALPAGAWPADATRPLGTASPFRLRSFRKRSLPSGG